MPLRHFGALAVAAVLIVGLPTVASADTVPSTLYVQPASGLTTCSDTGPGTLAEPFCDTQAAANIVQPGQTVVLDPNSNASLSGFTLTTSGTPSAPIVFTTTQSSSRVAGISLGSPVVLSGVHDVTIENFQVNAAVTVTGSTDVTMNRLVTLHGADITGASSAVTFTRSEILSQTATTPAVSVDQGDTGVVLSGDVIEPLNGGSEVGAAVTGATGTVIVNDTVALLRSAGAPPPCGSAFLLSGGSTGAVIENNLVTECSGAADEISVSADSTQGSILDYNVVQPPGSGAAYSWGGTEYTSATDLNAATGQGAHDIVTAKPLAFAGNQPAEGSPVIDSANANAPDVPATDLFGDPRVDDPLVTNTGTGSGDIDRGAVERQDPFSVDMNLPSKAPSGTAISSTVTASTAWGTITNYSVDFGDGTPIDQSSSPNFPHTYANTGNFTVVVQVTDSNGITSKPLDLGITVDTPAPLVPNATVSPDGLLTADIIGAATDSWNITNNTFDFNDGSPVQSGAVNAIHTFATIGTHPITVTFTDSGGNTASTTVQYTTSGARFTPTGPTRVLDTRNGTGGTTGPVPANGIVRLQLGGVGSIPAGVESVALNLTATDTTGAGFAEAYPDGGTRPNTSTVNFTSGQTVANTTIVPVGADGVLDLFVHGASADLVADVTGYFTQTQSADGYTPIAPARLIDTRDSGGAVPAGDTLTVPVTGTDGLPANGITAAAVNITVVNPASTGFVQAFPDGASRPNTSSVNFVAGQTVANMAVVPVGADGKIDVFNKSGGATDVIVDIAGYYTASGGSDYGPVTPDRTFDTRQTSSVQSKTPTLELVDTPQVLGQVTAMVLNVTVTDTTTPGFLTVYDPDGTLPATSNLNFAAGQTVANMAIPAVSVVDVELYNGGGAPVDVLGDVLGYFADN